MVKTKGLSQSNINLLQRKFKESPTNKQQRTHSKTTIKPHTSLGMQESFHQQCNTLLLSFFGNQSQVIINSFLSFDVHCLLAQSLEISVSTACFNGNVGVFSSKQLQEQINPFSGAATKSENEGTDQTVPTLCISSFLCIGISYPNIVHPNNQTHKTGEEEVASLHHERLSRFRAILLASVKSEKKIATATKYRIWFNLHQLHHAQHTTRHKSLEWKKAITLVAGFILKISSFGSEP